MIDNDLNGKTVLVVEDEIGILLLIKEELKKYGAKVLTAGTIRRAVKITTQEKIDFIVVDYKLEDGTGFDFLKKVEAHKKGIYCVLICGDMNITQKQCHDLGIKNLIKKPFSIQEVSHSILGIHPSLDSSEAIINTKSFNFQSIKIEITKDGEILKNLEVISYSKQIIILDSPTILEVGKTISFKAEFFEGEKGQSFEFSGNIIETFEEKELFTIHVKPDEAGVSKIEKFSDLALDRQKKVNEFLNKSRGF